MFVSSFYNSKIKKSETVFSPHPSLTLELVEEYINGYLPVEFRTVNGVDSLHIVEIDADLVTHSMKGLTARSQNQ